MSSSRKDWSFADTSRLLRAWGEAAAAMDVSLVRVFSRFEELSDGGHSGLAVNTIKVKRYALIYTHKFITELVTMSSGGDEAASKTTRSGRAASSMDKEADGNRKTRGGEWREERARAWFEMSGADRRQLYVTNYRVAHDYVHLTREQFDAVTRIKRAQPDVWERIGKTMSRLNPGGDAVDPIQSAVGNGVDSAMKHAGQRTGWTHSDTAALLRAWEARVTTRSRPTGMSIIRAYCRLTNSDRSEPVVTRKYKSIPNVHGVIMDRDANVDAQRGAVCSRCGEAQRWFTMSIVQRQDCFTRSNKMPPYKYLDLTAEHFDAMSRIKRLIADFAHGRIVHTNASSGRGGVASGSSSDSGDASDDSSESSSSSDEPVQLSQPKQVQASSTSRPDTGATHALHPATRAPRTPWPAAGAPHSFHPATRAPRTPRSAAGAPRTPRPAARAVVTTADPPAKSSVQLRRAAKQTDLKAKEPVDIDAVLREAKLHFDELLKSVRASNAHNATEDNDHDGDTLNDDESTGSDCDDSDISAENSTTEKRCSKTMEKNTMVMKTKRGKRLIKSDSDDSTAAATRSSKTPVANKPKHRSKTRTPRSRSLDRCDVSDAVPQENAPEDVDTSACQFPGGTGGVDDPDYTIPCLPHRPSNLVASAISSEVEEHRRKRLERWQQQQRRLEQMQQRQLPSKRRRGEARS